MAKLPSLRAKDLRAQWILTTMVLVTIITVALSAVAIYERNRSTQESLTKLGELLARQAASSSEYDVAVGDISALHSLVEGLVTAGGRESHDIAFAAIHYSSGEVAATEGDAAAKAPPLSPKDCRLREVRVDTIRLQDGRRVLQVLAPIRRFASSSAAEPALLFTEPSTPEPTGTAGVVRLAVSTEDARHAMLVANLWTLGIAVLILCAAIIGALKLAASVTAPVNQLVAATHQVAEGNLNWSVPVTRDDEIGQLARTFNTMVTNLRTIIKRVRDGVVRISAASSQLAAISEQQATGYAEQAASVEQITAAMEELAASAASIADNSESVVDIAEGAVKASSNGSHAVSDAIAEMERIRQTVQNIASTALRLGDRSQKIGEVVNFIQDIAAETHLLAVNAAIESAAAGEHGKRFAVVASEVRRLAERSRSSAEEIKALVTEIQTAINASVLATEQGTKEVESGANLARSVEANLEEITSLIERTSRTAKEISMATQHQRSASDQILAVVRGIADGVRSSAGEMRQASASVSQLTELADTFKDEVERFVVD